MFQVKRSRDAMHTNLQDIYSLPPVLNASALLRRGDDGQGKSLRLITGRLCIKASAPTQANTFVSRCTMVCGTS